MQWCVAIEEEFIKEAIASCKRGKKCIAIVLYTAAVEQSINQA